MIETKFLFFVLYSTVISVQLTSGQWAESTITEFRGGVLGGMGGRCLEHDLLEVKKYEDFVGVFEKPDDANEYFATSSDGIYQYCVQNVGIFSADVGYEVRVLVYISNVRGPHSFRFSVIDQLTDEVLTTEEDIYNNIWTYSTIQLTRKSSYKVQLEYTRITDDINVFFAIDKFVLRIPITTTEAPPTEPIESTSPIETTPTYPIETTPSTENPPTDITVNTTPTEAPPPHTTETTPPSEAPPTEPTESTPPLETTTTYPIETTPNTEDPPTNPTESITTTEEPPTDLTESTPSVDAPTTVPTETTTTSDSPTTDVTKPPLEPPAAGPCNCICNCNFYCNRKFSFP